MGASGRAIFASLALALSVSAQYYNDYTTPVPILKQINRHNDDGSYSYGYEGADGSFKIETKHTTGEQVYGKYGYVDDTGKSREVEYGASRRGFEPAGAGINVPPPTLQNNYVSSNAYGNDYDDGQYHEDPSVYYKNEQYNSRPRYNNPPPQQHYNNPPPQQRYNSPPQQHHNNPPQQRYDDYYSPPAHQHRPAPVHVDPNQFRGHPASKFDVSSGSYSLEYSG